VLFAWLPPYPIVAAILSGLVIAGVLVFGGRVSRLRAPGPRFKSAILIALGLLAAQWLALAALGQSPNLLDLLAGVAIIGAAAIIAFIGWSLIVWGFTLNMLLTLAAQGRIAGLPQWASLYTGGQSIQELTSDRIGVLIGSRLVERLEGDRWRLNPRGRVAARLLRVLRFAYGLGPRHG
jgi:hypothetical protein